MKQKKTNKTIPVQVIVRESCKTCDAVLTKLSSYIRKGGNIHLDIYNVDNTNQWPEKRQGFVTPATWVNDQLWYFGDFDLNEFHEKVIKMLENPRTRILA